MVLGTGREDQGLYIPQRSYAPKLGVHKCANNIQMSVDSSVLWNRIIRHAPIEVLKKHTTLSYLKYENYGCIVCHLAKYAKLPFQPGLSVSKAPFALVHYDIRCPYRVPT